MKKIAYTLIAFTWLFIFSATIKVFADEDLNNYDFYVQELPSVCGAQTDVDRYVEENGYVALNYSLGRAQSKSDGEPVFVLTYWVNEDVTQTMATVQVPNSDQGCILFITFDVIHNEDELRKEKRIKLRR